MTPAPVCIIYTQDAELVRRARAFLRTMAQVRHVSDPDRLEPVLQQAGPSVLMMDLRSKECRELIDQIQNEQPDVLIVAFGVAQSETLREAEQLEFMPRRRSAWNGGGFRRCSGARSII